MVDKVILQDAVLTADRAVPQTRIVMGTPTDFLSQQMGINDRYLTNTGSGWKTIMEVLPLDSSKFGVSMADGLVSITARDMPFYTLGFLDETKGSPILKAMIAILDKAATSLAQSCIAQSTETAAQYIFEKKAWDRDITRMLSEYRLLVVEEKLQVHNAVTYGVALVESENLKVFGPEVRLSDDDTSMRLAKVGQIDLRASGTFKMRAAEFDAKLRMLISWFTQRVWGYKPSIGETIEAALRLRMLPATDLNHLLSRTTTTVKAGWTPAGAATLAVFEEALKTLFTAYNEWAGLEGEAVFHVLHGSHLQKALLQKEENVKPYFGGPIDVKGSGSRSFAFMVGGCRNKVMKNLRFCLIKQSESQELPVGLCLEKDPLTLEKLFDQTPFRVGEPTREAGSIITATEDATVDAYPFRTTVTGGIINYHRTSFFSSLPDHKILLIPFASNQPRADFNGADFLKSVGSGNVSYFSGESGLCVGLLELNAEGVWV